MVAGSTEGCAAGSTPSSPAKGAAVAERPPMSEQPSNQSALTIAVRGCNDSEETSPREKVGKPCAVSVAL